MSHFFFASGLIFRHKGPVLIISKPTLRDVAKAAGVAITTVSSILNNRSDSWASEKTRIRVLAAAKELGYQPNQAARGLRLRRYNTIGALFSDLSNPFYAMLVRFLQQAFDQNGFTLIVEEGVFDADREAKCLASLVSRQIDGLVCSGLNYQSHGEALDRINLQMPVLVIGGTESFKGMDTVESDFRSSLFHAVDYLKSLGHERISYINAYPTERDLGRRTEHFYEALKKYGLAIGSGSYLNCDHYALGHLRETSREWLKAFPAGKRPTALICMNDLTAIGVSRGILDLPLRIPQDISLIGIDNVEVAAYLPFPLTTIAQPMQELASFCATRLVERIADNKRPDPVHRVLPTRLIIRESTGPAPVEQGG